MFLMKDLDHLRIPFQDIKVATKNFTTIIGKGGYGPVYTGKLLLSGNLTSVAVKRLPSISLSGQGLKEFLTEIHLLSRYKHPNVVSLLGYCEEGNEKILVYEYAKYGSFDKHLKTACQLTWRQRLNICIDAARGLDFLHNHIGEHHRVIHRDIKSANILLDQNWKAMIADFGLSKIGRTKENDTYLITNAGGTHGYCDPVYINTGILTKKSDVYSFGVVLFEALCGRLFFMDVVGEERLYVLRARRCYKEGKLNEIMDLNLKDSESVKEFSDIAYKCLDDDLEERPSMDFVLQKLEKALELHELEEAYELQVFVEALVLQELLEVMELQEFEIACELQEFEEELGLQKLVATLQGQELAEILVLQEFEEALELQKLMETLELHNLGEILNLQADYSIIKAIHMMTNTPPLYTTKEEVYTHLSTGILVDEGKVWFSIDDNGKINQEMISAITFMHPDPNKFEIISSPESRFGKVAKILNASKVDMQVEARAQFLSSDVNYAAYLVCKQESQLFGQPKLAGLKYKLNNQRKSYISYNRDYMDGGWVMFELFQTDINKTDVQIKILLEEIYVDDDDEVTVEGIMFFPIKKFDGSNKINKQEVENPPSWAWENLLPSDYQQLLQMAYTREDDHIHCTTKSDAYSILSEGVYIKVDETRDIYVWFWINALNGKKCCMLSPHLIQCSSPCKDYVPYPSGSDTRSNALVLKSSPSSTTSLSFKITGPFWSTNTSYGCYLVYRFEQHVANPVVVETKQHMPRGPCDENNHRWYNQKKIVYLRTPLSPVIGPQGTKISRSSGTTNKTNMIAYPENESDFWWEVKLGEFITFHGNDNDNQQRTHNIPPWICTCLPWLPRVSSEDYTCDMADNAATDFASLCLDCDPLISIDIDWRGIGDWDVNIPNMYVLGIEFRPL